MLTSRADRSGQDSGLFQGADYLTKPFSLGELEVRLGAILKRQRLVITSEKQPLTFEKLVIDLSSGR